MSAKVDPELCRRLSADAREDDARMTGGEWRPEPGLRIMVGERSQPNEDLDGLVADVYTEGDVTGIARTRNNLHAVAAQLTAAAELAERHEREMAALREVSDPDNETPELSLRDRIMHLGEQAALLVSVNQLAERRGSERDSARAEADQLRAEVALLLEQANAASSVVADDWHDIKSLRAERDGVTDE